MKEKSNKKNKFNNKEKINKKTKTTEEKINKKTKTNKEKVDKKTKTNKEKVDKKTKTNQEKLNENVKVDFREKVDKKTVTENKRNKKIGLIVCFFLSFVGLIIGLAYAVFTFNKLSLNGTAITGELYLKYLGGEVINMNNTLPRDTYDENAYFEFSVKGKNTSPKDVLYEIILEHGENIDEKIRIDDKFLKFRLVEVIDEKEVEIFNNKSFTSINNTPIHVDGVLANTNLEMEKTYRLYVWVNGVLIGNTENANYTSLEWANIYSNIKVLVKSDSKLEQHTYTVSFNQLLSSEYQEVEYIENSGVQYIDTGVIPTSTLKTEITYMDTSGEFSNYVLGSITGSEGEIIHYGLASDDNNLTIIPYYNTSTKNPFNKERVKDEIYHVILDMEHNKNSQHRMKATLEVLTNGIKEEVTTVWKEDLTGEIPNIYVFAIKGEESHTHSGMRLYSLKFYDEGKLIRNFIPCYRKSDGVIGLYDMVGEEFYENSGTGTFLKGNDVANSYHEANNQEFTYGIEESLDANTYYYEDKTFVGWNTKLDGSGETYLNSESVKNLSSIDKDIVNLYAMFGPPKSYVGYYIYDMLKEQAVADNQKSRFVTNETGIDFFDVSSKKNGYGVYTISSTINDEYPIYYYRGNVQTNNVLFDGFCWKIIRTTDTGGTKLIYNGKPVDGKCDNYGLDTFTTSGVYFATTTSTTVGLASAGYSYTEEKRLVTTTKTSGDIGKVPGTIFASDIEYVEITDETTGQASWKYRLIGEKVTSTGTKAAEFNAEREALLKEHHYTCFSATSDVCSTVYFVYMVRDNNNYYASFSNGLLLKDFLNIEFNGNSTNKTKATIHNNVNTWYINNLLDVDHYIEDTVYCNDRSLYQPWTNTSSVANNEDEKTHFGAKARIAYTGGVTVKCPNIADSFTVSKDKGNGVLENPIGLITLDEVVLAGYAWGKESTDNYLYTGDSKKVWWTMSPGFISAAGVYPGVVYSMLDTVGVNYRGSQDANKIWSGGGVRPVISLKNNTIIGSGFGTKEDPFVLQ